MEARTGRAYRDCMQRTTENLYPVLSSQANLDSAARAIAAGAVVGHAFANFYVITTRSDADVVCGVNLMKGWPADQVGSLTTTRELVPNLFDWSKLPAGL